VRRLVIALIVLALLLVGLDVGSRLVAQYAVSRNVAASFDLPERPNVSLGGFPFLPSFFAGSVPTMTVTAGPTTMEGVSIRGVHLTLRNVSFSAGAILTGGDGSIEARRGEGEAVIDGATVPASVLGQTVTIHVRFEGDRTVVEADGLPGSIGVDPELDAQGNLVLRPESGLLPVSVTVPLPTLVQGVDYASLDVQGGVATLGLRVRNAVVPCC
jgi:hypothetical protein